MKNIFILFLNLIILLSVSNLSIAQDIGLDVTVTDIQNIRGLVRPSYTAVLSSEISARITEIKYKPGERFNEGDLLVKFDCALYDADT